MEQETTVKKINTITVGSKTFSGRAMVYQCTMVWSRIGSKEVIGDAYKQGA